MTVRTEKGGDGDPSLPSDSTAAGEKIDWQSIIERHNRRVIVFLLGMGLGIEEAKEIAQSTWLSLIDKHQRGLIERLQFPGIAISQARFAAFEFLRLRRAEQRRVAAAESEAKSWRPEHVDIEEKYRSRETLRRATDILNAASPAVQGVFRLLYGEPGVSPEQAATELGLSVQRVRQIVCELRKKLRASVEGI